MPRHQIRLVKVDQTVREWLERIGFWDEEVAFRVNEASGYLPLDLEGKVQDLCQGNLGPNCMALLQKLIDNSDGILLSVLGIPSREWKDAQEDGNCACVKLVKWELARARDEQLLRPLPAAFDDGVLYLVGFNETL